MFLTPGARLDRAADVRVKLSASRITVGNSTSNHTANSTLIQVVNSTSTANLTPLALTIGSTLVNSTAVVSAGIVNAVTSVNSALLTVGTAFVANSTAIVGTGFANITTSVNSALLTVGTAFIANSTAIVGTGFANITTSVNSALLTVGTAFIANSTAIVGTGFCNVTTSVNSAAHTVGTAFIANSTAIVGTGFCNVTTSVNSALLTVGTAFIANTTGAYHTGTMNAASHTTTAVTVNATVVAVGANNIINVTAITTGVLDATHVGIAITNTDIRIGNSSINVIANSTIWTGIAWTANNSTNLGGVAGTNYARLDTNTASTATQLVAGGARITVMDLGSVSALTITPDPGNRPFQKCTNNGVWTLAPGTNTGAYLLDVINTTGAAVPTTSGWTKVVGSFDSTTTSKFRCHCSISGDFSMLQIVKAA